MTELFLNFGAYFMLMAVTFYFVSRAIASHNSNGYLSNDLSRDSQRWTSAEIKIAAYVAIFQTSKLRLDQNYQAAINATLKRSDRSVMGQMRRVSALGAANSDASKLTEDIALSLAAMTENEAERVFFESIISIGGDAELIRSLIK
mgnify:CR=1 FL=1|tara:strand:- start:1374 stop:1811 length:438 start_codon:yes stop_codon:yes gene_type:complete